MELDAAADLRLDLVPRGKEKPVSLFAQDLGIFGDQCPHLGGIQFDEFRPGFLEASLDRREKATGTGQIGKEAFLRRLDFVVDFPFPEPADRERIWRLLLPQKAPLADDVDLVFLAHQFKLAGGNIRNASLAAAFLAAEDGGVIAMRHLVRGVALEYGKLGRLTLESDFEQFHDVARALR